MNIYDIKELRIKRRLAHHANKRVRSLGPSPEMDRIRSIAREEARRINLLHAFMSGRMLSDIETTPYDPVRGSPFIGNQFGEKEFAYRKRVYNLLTSYPEVNAQYAYSWAIAS